jgi:hypothetical protein
VNRPPPAAADQANAQCRSTRHRDDGAPGADDGSA